MGCVDIILGIKVIWKENDIILSQSHYIERILTKYSFTNSKSNSTSFTPHIKLVCH